MKRVVAKCCCKNYLLVLGKKSRPKKYSWPYLFFLLALFCHDENLSLLTGLFSRLGSRLFLEVVSLSGMNLLIVLLFFAAYRLCFFDSTFKAFTFQKMPSDRK